MAKIFFLGTASGVPTENRYCGSTLVSINRDLYLLDGGEPCSASLVRANIDYNRIRSIFISHMHVDHFGGIPLLIQVMQLKGKCGQRKSDLKLFVPHEGISGIKEYLKALYLVDELLPFKLKIISIKDNPVYRDNNLKIYTHTNKHLGWWEKETIAKKYPKLRGSSYSFVIQAKGKKIVYSGDIKEVHELEPLMEKADLLILEMAHVLPEEIFKFLADKAVAKIVCNHIHPDWNDKDDEYQKLGQEHLGKRFCIAYDGMEIDI
ncbi:MAG: MBL fold metallo-hydrolase [Candidatus Omnitrophica bacterium]|nr:MBL fold metallo-hydrolase [Candidatus Omnitrophota bacterium]